VVFTDCPRDADEEKRGELIEAAVVKGAVGSEPNGFVTGMLQLSVIVGVVFFQVWVVVILACLLVEFC